MVVFTAISPDMANTPGIVEARWCVRGRRRLATVAAPTGLYKKARGSEFIPRRATSPRSSDQSTTSKRAIISIAGRFSTARPKGLPTLTLSGGKWDWQSGGRIHMTAYVRRGARNPHPYVLY